MAESSSFSGLSNDVVIAIFFKLEDDPRHWARLACVCTRFSYLIRSICWQVQCHKIIPTIVSDLLTGCEWSVLYKLAVCCPGLHHAGVCLENSDFGLELDIGPRPDRDISVSQSSKTWRSVSSHLASGTWNLSREQGNKLLASRFRRDSLYICHWPGCVHIEKKRNYMLFRGIFKNFKRSMVWRTINDGHRSKIGLDCAYCGSQGIWDLHTSFCLKRGFGYHDDGEPVVRAFVCQNGHVSGVWTDFPLYS